MATENKELMQTLKLIIERVGSADNAQIEYKGEGWSNDCIVQRSNISVPPQNGCIDVIRQVSRQSTHRTTSVSSAGDTFEASWEFPTRYKYSVNGVEVTCCDEVEEADNKLRDICRDRIKDM